MPEVMRVIFMPSKMIQILIEQINIKHRSCVHFGRMIHECMALNYEQITLPLTRTTLVKAKLIMVSSIAYNGSMYSGG